MKAKQRTEIVTAILSAVIKILIAVWLVNFIYTKAVDAYDFGYRVFTEPAVSPAPGRDVTFALTEGKTGKALAESLYEKGLVRDEKLAFAQIMASEYRESLVPGVYELNTSMTLEEMMAVMGGEVEEETEEDEEE